MPLCSPKVRKSGTTLIETIVAVTLMVTFFATLFELNGVCLRYINSTKEAVGAIQGVQDRVEQLRNLDFPSLTSTAAMTTLLTLPANTSPMGARVTENVTVKGYPSGSPTITYTRTPGASVTPTKNPSSVDFSSTTLVQVDVTYQWSMTLGGRARTSQASTIISAGTKK